MKIHSIYFILGILIFPPFDSSLAFSLVEDIKEILELNWKGNDLVLLTDFHDQDPDSLIQGLMKLEIPLRIIDIRSNDGCDVVNYDDQVKKKDVVIWTEISNLKKALAFAEKSAFNCSPWSIFTGLLGHQNAMFIVTKEKDMNETKFLISSGKIFDTHMNLAILLALQDHSLIVWNNPFVHGQFHFADSKELNRPDFNRKDFELIVTHIPYSFRTILDIDPDAKDPRFPYVNATGYEIIVMNEFAKMYGFSYKIFGSSERMGGGLRLVNGSIQGIGYFKDMIAGDVDLCFTNALSPLIIKTFAIISQANTNSFFLAAVPIPRAMIRKESILETFTFELWITILVFFLFFSLIASFFVKFWKNIMNDDHLPRYSQIFGLNLWLAWGTLVGERIIFKEISLHWSRFIIGTWMLACFILACAYNGTLRSIMMAPSIEKQIDSAEDILESGLTPYILQYGAPMETRLAESEDPAIRQLYTKAIKVPHYTSHEDLMQKVYERKGVLLEYSSGIFYSIAEHFSTPHGKPLISVTKQFRLGPLLSSWLFNPLSLGHTEASQFQMIVRETGHDQKWKTEAYKIWTERNKASDKELVIKEPASLRPISWTDLSLLTFVWVFGLVLSILTFIMEIAKRKWMKL